MKFYFHPTGRDNTGRDNNGDFEPGPQSAGWIVLEANSYKHAVEQLPPEEQKKVFEALNDEYTLDSYKDFLSDTCGDGAGYTLMDQNDWDAFQDDWWDDWVVKSA